MALTTLIISALYFIGLFWLARWGDSDSERAQKFTRHPLVYSLTLAIYCTSWTYFGAVGNAAQDGWSYLPIFIGPILLLVFGSRFVRKILIISKKQKLISLADFLSSRYGKRRMVAIFVTIIALLATIPYIALQLKALGMSFSIIAASQANQSISYYSEMVMFATFMMVLFAIFFGTRKVDITEYRGGLMLAIAFESVVKLVALVGIAIFAMTLDKPTVVDNNPFTGWGVNDFLSTNFLTQTFMAAAAFICLPRQYHVAVVDNENVEHLKTARWSFPIYLVFISLAIIPITTAGLSLFDGSEVNADTFVLALPLMTDNYLLSILAFIGGLSASTAMIIVATLALSTMISNDVMLPLMLRKKKSGILDEGSDYSRQILMIRRMTIVAILLSSYLYHQLFSSNAALSNIGLLAFSLVIQLMPVLVGALYWKTGHANGVMAGLGAGIITCFMFIINPDPEVNISQTSYLVTMVITSLILNTVAYIFFSVQAQPRLVDKMQAAAFINPMDDAKPANEQDLSNIRNSDLKTLLITFLGQARTNNLLQEFEHVYQIKLKGQELVTPEFAQHCEILLGGVIGASSSRSIMSAVLSGRSIEFEDMVTFFGDTTEALSFNQNILFTSLENLDQGISVVNQDLELVAWNRRYLELFNYPAELISVGTPIESLIRYNASRGECGPGDLEEQVTKRLNYMRTGSAHRFLRRRSDGRVIEMVGNPLPNGGFVTSFTDITEHIETQHALDESNIDLQKRIKDRTREVSEINQALTEEIERRSDVEAELTIAKAQAEQANAMKTRFLALASHDILQPLNAAKLYLASIDKQLLDDSNREVVGKVGESLRSTESLIQTLLEISQLDDGSIEPDIKPFDLADLLLPLLQEQSIIASQSNLKFNSRIRHVIVNTDETYLRRILQNLISNAIKYTHEGGVLVAMRVFDNTVKIQVLDTGPGISEFEQQRIFQDFYRVKGQKEAGVGLGLAVVARLSALLESPISIRSDLGKGSSFELTLPIYKGDYEQQQDAVSAPQRKKMNLNVLCVDDQQENLDALARLLDKWGCQSVLCTKPEEAIAFIKTSTPDVILMDYQLSDDGQNGLELIETCRIISNEGIPSILITALREKELKQEAADMGVHYLSKPVKPASLRALLNRINKS